MKSNNVVIVVLSVLIFILLSCNKRHKISEPIKIKLEECEYSINKDSLAKIEGIQCNDSTLIVFDYYSGKSFTAFDLKTGAYLGRFGEIGNGPGEIPLGCTGHLINNNFYIHFLSSGLIEKYDMDSIRRNINHKPSRLTRFKFPFSSIHLSKAIPINDSVYYGAGLYNGKYQYIIFNNNNKVINYSTEVYNSKDDKFNIYHKMISNEGTLRKHPVLDKFVYFVKRSSNIDFMKVDSGKINPIKLLREKNPELKPIQNGSIVRVQPELHCEIGYIDIAAGINNIYALYTDKNITNPYCSKTIKVFDWNGKFVKKYELSKDAYYITVNEKKNVIYTAFRDEDDGWDITSYKIKE